MCYLLIGVALTIFSLLSTMSEGNYVAIDAPGFFLTCIFTTVFWVFILGAAIIGAFRDGDN